MQESHDYKESASDRVPSLPEKQAKARAILARTNASTLVSHEHVSLEISTSTSSSCIRIPPSTFYLFLHLQCNFLNMRVETSHYVVFSCTYLHGICFEDVLCLQY